MTDERLTYNFAEGPDHYNAMELWQTIKSLSPHIGGCRVDKVLWALRRGLITETEASLVASWLSVFQVESFAQ